MNRVSSFLWLSTCAALLSPSLAMAQQYPSVNGRQFPLNQMTPVGVAGQWAEQLGRACDYIQPVRISLPTSGVVTYYEGSPDRPYDLPAPAQAGLLVGRTYRLRLSNLPEFPGMDFYPTIELIDRLHPPQGKAEEFPVEFEFTVEELEWATADRLVTKVVYLEQPDRIPVTKLDTKERITTVEPYQNVIAEADLLGRPVAIVRMGGRRPDMMQPEPGFFGPGGPVRVQEQALQQTARARRASAANAIPRDAGVVRLQSGTSRKMARR